MLLQSLIHVITPFKTWFHKKNNNTKLASHCVKQVQSLISVSLQRTHEVSRMSTRENSVRWLWTLTHKYGVIDEWNTSGKPPLASK